MCKNFQRNIDDWSHKKNFCCFMQTIRKKISQILRQNLVVLDLNQKAASVFSRNCNYSIEYRITNKYGDEYCMPCSTCRPGTGMMKPCSKDHNIICSKCTNGTFSHGGHKPCKPCRRCTGHFHTARACTPHRNSHCKACKPGRYFEPKRLKCKKCQICPPGTYIKRKCSPLHDTECAACPLGTFSNEYNLSPFCKICTRCQPLEEIRQVCNKTHNSVCGNCKTGFFRLESTLRCAQCSDCYPENPGFTFPIPECVRTVNNSRYTCMPMMRPPFHSILMQGHERASEYKTITEENNERNTLYIVVSVVTLFLFVLVCISLAKATYTEGVRKEYLSTRNFTGNKMFSFVSQSCSDSMLYSSSECSKIAVVKRISKSLQDSSSFWETEAFDNFLNENNTITRYPKSHSSHACEDSSIKKSKINSIEEKTIPSNQQNMISCNDRKTNSTNSCSSNSNAEEYINFSEEGNMNYENDSQTNLNKDGCMEASVKRHVNSSDKEEYSMIFFFAFNIKIIQLDEKYQMENTDIEKNESNTKIVCINLFIKLLNHRLIFLIMCVNTMYRALDKINYNTLTLNKKKIEPSNTREPLTLLELSCIGLNNSLPSYLEEALLQIPAHLAPCLLRTAIEHLQPGAVSIILSNWPLTHFQEVLGEHDKDIFLEEMGFDLVVFHHTFTKLVIQMWPILSLKKSMLKPKKLAKIIAKTAGVESGKLSEEIIPGILNTLLEHEMVKNSQFTIYIPKESVSFTTSNTFFMDYLICNCLRSITPVYIAVSNIYIKIIDLMDILSFTNLMVGEETIDSLAPFIVLRGHDTRDVEGIALKQLEEGVFFIVSADLHKFTNLRALDLSDCNVYLQEGCTRSRTYWRSKMSQTLHCFKHLVKLDLSFNYLLGCLGELLDALNCPLEYLSLRGCDLNEHDLDCLSNSKHAPKLRELNLSKVCQFSIFENDHISPVYLLKSVKHFTSVCILNLAQNNIPDSSVTEFCDTIKVYLKELKSLDLAKNILTDEHLMDLTRTVAGVKSMQLFRLTWGNILEDGHLVIINDNGVNMKKKLSDILCSLGRSDIIIDLVQLTYTIFVGLMDLMDIN
ncbi:LOW QUALITY PROTEIN: hypothetical protein KUTeg_000722 [Tegillarca granosa]|uniref:TNFR-Cys domain-containing protein n=1 Tax=Tegillarca granosa TaxID=220873 RepID=A0ABQ9FYC6_TEGGR|nr:LOW QUALITY PROTEIN: hypothetical protein KUTeg_000722 [Tegillarca granosa]